MVRKDTIKETVKDNPAVPFCIMEILTFLSGSGTSLLPNVLFRSLDGVQDSDSRIDKISCKEYNK